MINYKNKKNNKLKTFFLDKHPYIPFIIIVCFAFLIFFIIINHLSLDFFSAKQVTTSEEEKFELYIASPTKNQTFEIVSTNETIPIKIKSKELENNNYNYTIKVFIDDSLVGNLKEPPFEFNWSPPETGIYNIYAEIVDEHDKSLYSTEKIPFSVNFSGEIANQPIKIENLNIEEKKNKILEKAQYRSQNASPIFAYKCYTSPVIDGNLDDWEFFEKFTYFNPTIKKENYTNAQDCSGVFSSCWDENNYYFFIKVTDDVYNQPFTTNLINKGDSVVLVFDSELEKDFNIPFLNNDDYEIDFSAGDNSGSSAESFVRWPSNAPLRNAVIASKKGSGGYIIEASIPWVNMPTATILDETIFGFTVSILDTDNLESTELVISSSKQFDFNNVSTLGTLILIDVGDLAKETKETSSTTNNQ